MKRQQMIRHKTHNNINAGFAKCKHLVKTKIVLLKLKNRQKSKSIMQGLKPLTKNKLLAPSSKCAVLLF